jgi:hypothetical protein
MSLSILQTPATASLAQSPMIFSVSSSINVTQSNFQYVGNLYYWTGSVFDTGSSKYTLIKYPNSSKVGLFDVSRIINSTLTDLAIQNTSNVVYYKVDFSTQYNVGNQIVTGSTSISSSVLKALDGYAIFQEPINQQINNKTQYWPVMTDGPVTQSVFDFNKGTFGVFVSQSGGTTPTEAFYSSSIGTASIALSSSVSSSQQIQQIPAFPSQSGFPLSTFGLTEYTIQPKSAEGFIGSPIRFELTCVQKYPNIRIKWKNRFGQFDYLNFYGVSQNSFSTDRRTYEPQIGTWESTTLSYNSYDAQIKPYVVNAKQQLTVNSQWLPQDYNDLIKQLLSADEAYWVYNEDENDLRPISIVTDSIQFKTGVVDKVIQYTFQFDWAQNYKLII